jgi:hypothetical protein
MILLVAFLGVKSWLTAKALYPPEDPCEEHGCRWKDKCGECNGQTRP